MNKEKQEEVEDKEEKSCLTKIKVNESVATNLECEGNTWRWD